MISLKTVISKLIEHQQALIEYLLDDSTKWIISV